MDFITAKTISCRTVDRYYILTPRLAEFRDYLRDTGAGDGPASRTERALAHEFLREARSITSRDGFGRSLRYPRHGDPLTRNQILSLLAEAQLALSAFSTLYRDTAEDEFDNDGGSPWNYDNR